MLFAGSFSKVLFPALRLGYLVVPLDLVDRVTALQSIRTRHAPTLTQAILCDFVAEGHFARHVRRMREVYAERLGVLLQAARERLEGALAITGWRRGCRPPRGSRPAMRGATSKLARRSGTSTSPRSVGIPKAGCGGRVFTSGSRQSL